MKTGKPAKDAVHELFQPILDPLADYDPGEIDSGSEVPSSLGWVWYLKSQTYPEAIFHRGEIGKQANAKLLKETLPELGHVRFVDGTPGGLMYACAEAALRVWVGGDLSTDPVESMERSKARKSDEKYGVEWPDDFKLKTLLARLAVPHSVAHQWWGWGSKAKENAGADVVPLRSVAPAPTKPDESAPDSADDVKTFAQLVSWRKSNPKANWTVEHKKILYSKEKELSKDGKGADKKRIASELGITVQRVRELIRNINTQSKSDKKRAA